jgi:putative YphP/YqiW family bacilliredoxin
MPYDPRMVQPMRDELTGLGVQELRTAADVDAFMAETEGISLLVVNSVCGCAAGSARPGLGRALQLAPRPDRVATVFAGQDLEATARARSYFPEYEPSSPSFAFFRGGKPAGYVSRRMIEGQPPERVEHILTTALAAVTTPAAF